MWIGVVVVTSGGGELVFAKRTRERKGKSQEETAVIFELRTHLIVALVKPAVSNDMNNETIALSGTACPF